MSGPLNLCADCTECFRCDHKGEYQREVLFAWAYDQELPICISKEERKDNTMDINLEPVDSSFVAAVGHNGEDMMIVEYRNGKKYAFHGISASQFEDIKSSSSIGSAINRCGVKGVEL